MNISDWLDSKEKEEKDISAIVLPAKMLHAEDPDETVFYEEIRPCGLFCTKDHPFATVERYGHWYRARGRDKEEGVHSTLEQWSKVTRDKELALQTAKSHIES